MVFLNFSESAPPDPGQKILPETAMRLAVSEALKGLGRVSPNPPVGCVIVDREHRFLAKGHHRAFGESHAEIEALKEVTDKKQLAGASLYVTLEPCAHQGKTPPCVEELLKHPLKTVIYGERDPHLAVCGKGLKQLEENGVQTIPFSFYQKELRQLYEAFFFNVKFQRAFVALKVACSLDGQAAFSSGKSQWITGAKSREAVACLRGCYDAVLIGRGAFLQDNPRLNSRHPKFHGRTNKAVVLDPEGRGGDLISGSRLREVRSDEEIIWVVGKESAVSEDWPARVLKAPFMKHRSLFCLKSLLEILYRDFHISSVLVEGGIEVFSSFVEQDQIQRLFQFIGPVIMGGIKGRGWTENVSLNSLRPALQDVDCLATGDGALVTGRWIST